MDLLINVLKGLHCLFLFFLIEKYKFYFIFECKIKSASTMLWLILTFHLFAGITSYSKDCKVSYITFMLDQYFSVSLIKVYFFRQIILGVGKNSKAIFKIFMSLNSHSHFHLFYLSGQNTSLHGSYGGTQDILKYTDLIF